jgi:hypothetical protein
LTPAEKKKQEEDRKKDATQDAPPQGM